MFSVGEQLGFRFNILDIGGGFPGIDSATISFEDIATELNTALDLHFPVSRNVTIIAEPGRYYASACYTLAVTVSSKREVEKPDGESHQYGAAMFTLQVHSVEFKALSFSPIVLAVMVCRVEEYYHCKMHMCGFYIILFCCFLFSLLSRHQVIHVLCH